MVSERKKEVKEELGLMRIPKEGMRRLKRTVKDVFRVEMLLLLFTVVMALVAFGDTIYSAFFALFLKDFGVPVEEIGIFFTAFFASTALVSIPAGYISDRLGRNVITVSLLVLAAIVFSYTLTQTKTQLFLLRIAQGAVMGFIFPVARAFVMDKTTEKNRGQTLGTFTFFITIAGMAAPTIGGVLRDRTGSFTALFYIAAICSVGAAFFLMLAIRDMGTGFSVTKMRLPTRELVGSRAFLVVLLMFGMLYFANGVLTPIMSIFAVDELGMSYTLLGLLSLCMGILYAFSQFVAGTLSDRLGRKNLLVYPLFIYVIGVFVAGLSVNYVMFFLMYLLVGIGAAPYATVAYGLIGDVLKPEQRGTASGAITSVGSLGMIVGPLVGAALGGIVGMRIPFFVCAAIVLATVGMLFILLPQDSKR